MSETNSYRLLTRADFDGLVCAVLFKSLDMINEIMFVHPKDMQDGKIKVNENDITANLPYVPGCHLVFDHHHSEILRTPASERKNHVIDPDAPSAARVVYNYYNGERGFPNVPVELIVAVDKADSANFSHDEIIDPQGWNLLSFLMDARTGLGRYRHFRISNYQLMMDLIDHCLVHKVDAILELPDVHERVVLYNSHREKFEEQLRECSKAYGPLVVIDLREEDLLYVGNRFLIYTLYPEWEMTIHVIWGLGKKKTVYAMGKSIFNRANTTNIGALMLQYGGGGHAGAGTCQVNNADADRVLSELIQHIAG